eukprot:TRINITY_DN90183_c0_g1_i1.p1 TRINITY_DN90183_c0_g1~~TRINITY_DN90183_c0_g1_i1.p1  ORF type:complete len:561 (-),score=156.75 TRINITY_DN90183_c0_g1_i1:128-1810(-)
MMPMMLPPMMQPGFAPGPQAYWPTDPGGMTMYGQSPLYAATANWAQPMPQVAFPWQQPVAQAFPWAQSQQVDPVGVFMEQLGIQPEEDVYFGWVAEYGLAEECLPRPWSMQRDASTGQIYYVNTDDGSSSWENPLLQCLQDVLNISRMYLHTPTENFFEEQKIALYAHHKEQLDGWYGPLEDETGRQYFANDNLGKSSWHDPREETQHIWKLQSDLLDALQDMLYDYLPEKLPAFGDGAGEYGDVHPNRLPGGAEVWTLHDSSADVQEAAPYAAEPEEPQSPQSPKPPVTPRAARVRATMKEVIKTEVAIQDHKSNFEKMLKAAYFIYQDNEESQQMVIARKVKERRLRKQRLEDQDRQRIEAELEEMRQRQEERAREAAALLEAQRKKQKEDAEIRRRQEQERKLAEEEARRQDEEAKRIEAERLRDEAKRKAEEAERKRLEEEEAARKRKERKEQILREIPEMAHNRDAYTLRTFIKEAEGFGFDKELEPVRAALREEEKRRAAAALKARKAQEDLAAQFKDAKEAADFGGSILAAQWRAAVREIQKPMPVDLEATLS